MKKQLLLLAVTAMIGLSGCGTATTDGNSSNNNGHSQHEVMNHSSSAEVPKDIKVAQNPTYKVASEVIVKADHMAGMKGATATISGAYDTTAYVVSYNPTTGGERVKNHKWVIHEEIKNAGAEAFKPGTEVTIEADHMPGMKGATATIESAERTTVYMIDFTPTTGGERVKNHKWVTESELGSK